MVTRTGLLSVTITVNVHYSSARIAITVGEIPVTLMVAKKTTLAHLSAKEELNWIGEFGK